ncbi:MAG: DNA/RNA nuclease SfsA [Ruminococcaceae bacterium]|nr:DNA/RNA nuclease SfsA [Oscillospiraceae bacterium]
MNIDEAQLIKGIFQHELKNRFRCIVRINGKDELCYVPSSCRLSNFIDLEGKAVLLTPSINSITLPLTLLATAEGRKATILNLSVANEVVFEALNGRRFSFLGKRTSARREVLINGYKADVYIEDTHTAMEIKTIISSQKNALFPSVKSERSLRQLERIKLLLEEGYNVCYTFVSLSPRVRSIELDRASAFYPAFLACVKKGMSYYGCSLEYRKGEIGIAASIEVII